MVVLRPTRVLQKLLPPSVPLETGSTPALGDWYVNRLVVDRRPLLLLVSSASLLPVVVPAHDARSLPARLALVVGQRLRRAGVAQDLIDAEVRAMTPVAITGTLDRSVLGIMVDFAKSLPYYIEPGNRTESELHQAEARLAETPCFAGKRGDRVVSPEAKAPTLLNERWNGKASQRGTTRGGRG